MKFTVWLSSRGSALSIVFITNPSSATKNLSNGSGRWVSAVFIIIFRTCRFGFCRHLLHRFCGSGSTLKDFVGSAWGSCLISFRKQYEWFPCSRVLRDSENGRLRKFNFRRFNLLIDFHNLYKPVSDFCLIRYSIF